MYMNCRRSVRSEEHPADEDADQSRCADKSDLCRRQRQCRLQDDECDADDRQRDPSMNGPPDE
jgi:hypothetical protein